MNGRVTVPVRLLSLKIKLLKLQHYYCLCHAKKVYLNLFFIFMGGVLWLLIENLNVFRSIWNRYSCFMVPEISNVLLC